MNYLKNINPHKKDRHISFEPHNHTYTIQNESDYLSVTKFVYSHFKKFDSNTVIDKMIRNKNWINSPYYGMSKYNIRKLWNDNKINAANAGTEMHSYIESYYNNNIINNNSSTEIKFFYNFIKDFPELIPYRTEWMIWDRELKIAGSVDMVFKNKDDKFEIFDWKRSKFIKKENKWDKSITKCISHIPDSNFWHYSLQLNIYKAILEKNYGIKIEKMTLLCLHPDNTNYLKYDVPNLNNEINDLFEQRIIYLNDPNKFKLIQLEEEKKKINKKNCYI